jgi:hypothetical protein
MTERAEPRQGVAYILGRIEGQLETVNKTLAEDRMASAQYRTDMRKELQANRDEVQKLKATVDGAVSDISEMKPKVDSLEARALMSAGAARLAVVLGKFAHIISAAIGGAVVFFLQKWLGR